MVMPLHIRPFRFDDVAAIAALMDDLGYPTSAEAMRRRMECIAARPDYRTFVADLDNQVVGMIGLCRTVLYESDAPLVQIMALVVSPPYRGRGIGKSLLFAAEQWARDQGASGVYLTSGMRPERSEAHLFYERLGFEKTGYRFVKMFC